MGEGGRSEISKVFLSWEGGRSRQKGERDV